MRKLRAGVVGSLGLFLVAGVTVAVPATSATGSELVASWQMNETSGSVMVDSSGNGIDGAIGPDVVLGEATPDGGLAYRFKGDWWIPNDNRLIQIPDNPNLDPGSGTFQVTLRVKTGALDPNITQKGQARTTGGYWKFVVKKGWPRCHFRDGTGKTLAVGFVNSKDPNVKVSDGEWHTISCARTATGVAVSIDGITKAAKGSLGPIDNHFPMTIGGKVACDYVTVTCDYYAGAIDWITVERP